MGELSGFPSINASLLDESTAAAEAMLLCYRSHKRAEEKDARTFLVVGKVFRQTQDVLQGRAVAMNFDLRMVSGEKEAASWIEKGDVFGILAQIPASDGAIVYYDSLFAQAREKNIRCFVCADILSLFLLRSIASMGADGAIGSTQRLGIPMGYGGPHAAYFATRKELMRLIPGRIVGVSKDCRGKTAYRMALQSREQHIRRGRANSNICTAQTLPAIMAAFYSLYHGKEGLIAIAQAVHKKAKWLHKGLAQMGIEAVHRDFF